MFIKDVKFIKILKKNKQFIVLSYQPLPKPNKRNNKINYIIILTIATMIINKICKIVYLIISIIQNRKQIDYSTL